MDPIKANIIIEPSFDSDLAPQNLPLHFKQDTFCLPRPFFMRAQSEKHLSGVKLRWPPAASFIFICEAANCFPFQRFARDCSKNASVRATNAFEAASGPADATKLFAWNLLGICAESFGMFGTALPKKELKNTCFKWKTCIKHGIQNCIHVLKKLTHFLTSVEWHFWSFASFLFISDNALRDKSCEHLRWTCARTRVVEATPQDAHTIRCLMMSSHGFGVVPRVRSAYWQTQRNGNVSQRRSIFLTPLIPNSKSYLYSNSKDHLMISSVISDPFWKTWGSQGIFCHRNRLPSAINRQG